MCRSRSYVFDISGVNVICSCASNNLRRGSRLARPALSATRAAAVIALLAGSPRRAWTMAQIVDATGINVGSCFAVLASLVTSGLLSKCQETKSYRLGPALMAAGLACFESEPEIGLARSAAALLARDLDAATLLTVMVGTDQLVLHHSAAPDGRRFEVGLGQRVSLTPPLGAHLIAWAQPDDVAAWLGRAAADAAGQWGVALENARRRGYIVMLRDANKPPADEMLAELSRMAGGPDTSGVIADLLEEYRWDLLLADMLEPSRLYDVSTIAAPIVRGGERPLLSLSVGRFRQPVTGQMIHSISRSLLEACRSVVAGRE